MMWVVRPLQHPASRIRRRLLLILPSLRLFSQSAAGRGDAPAGPAHFMVDYLVSSCGLSRIEALRSSQPLTHLKTPKKPDAVLRLLRQEGLGGAHIRRAVQKFPRVLLFNPEKTLEPKIRALQAAGLSGSEVAQLISLSPRIFESRDPHHRLEFWRKVLGTNQNVFKAVSRAPLLLCSSLDNRVIPRLSLLRDLGIPDDKVGTLIVRRPRWIHIRSDWLNALAEKVKSLGFTPGSRMFVQAITSVGNLSSRTIDAKCKLLRGFGWTQDELMFAIRQFPTILTCSEKRIHTIMCFLLNEAGCEPSYVARRPALVGYSLEKRLIPRNYVLQYLKTKGLAPSIRGFYATMQMSDYIFIRKFIVPYKDQLPELLEAYQALVPKQAKANIDGSQATRQLWC